MPDDANILTCARGGARACCVAPDMDGMVAALVGAGAKLMEMEDGFMP